MLNWWLVYLIESKRSSHTTCEQGWFNGLAKLPWWRIPCDASALCWLSDNTLSVLSIAEQAVLKACGRWVSVQDAPVALTRLVPAQSTQTSRAAQTRLVFQPGKGCWCRGPQRGSAVPTSSSCSAAESVDSKAPFPLFLLRTSGLSTWASS